jgi:membrane protein
LKRALRGFDAYQQAHTWVGFPVAVAKKFKDDRAGYLAGLVAYYAFFSLFPLLLILVSILGFLLGESSDFRQRVIDSVVDQIPVIGVLVSADIESIQGSGFALAVGLSGTLLLGLGVVRALQHGMDQVWNVPKHRRPKFLKSRARPLTMLGVLGLGAIGSTLISGVGSSGQGGWSSVLGVAGVLGRLGLNFALFLVAFRLLTNAVVGWRDVLPGAAFAAFAWALLQALGGYIVRNQLTRASAIYGFFAVVIGLLSWLTLGALVTLLAAEINVVKTRRLWPRNLVHRDRMTVAETIALSGLAKQEQMHPSERIEVSFDGSPAAAPVAETEEG